MTWRHRHYMIKFFQPFFAAARGCQKMCGSLNPYVIELISNAKHFSTLDWLSIKNICKNWSMIHSSLCLYCDFKCSKLLFLTYLPYPCQSLSLGASWYFSDKNLCVMFQLFIFIVRLKCNRSWNKVKKDRNMIDMLKMTGNPKMEPYWNKLMSIQRNSAFNFHTNFDSESFVFSVFLWKESILLSDHR